MAFFHLMLKDQVIHLTLYFLRFHIETIIHVLWECDVVQNFIKSISDLLGKI